MGVGGPSRLLMPTPIPNLSQVVAISANTEYAVARLADGTLMEWGDSGYTSSRANLSVPAPVANLSGVVSVFTNQIGTLALRNDGTVWFWLDGPPESVDGLSGIVAVSGGGYHFLALKSNGTVLGWGNNQEGQLGFPANNTTYPITPIPGLSGVQAIAGGGYDSIALFTNGTVAVFGEGDGGEIGDGKTTEFNPRPTVVKNLGSVFGMDMGGNFAVAIAEASLSPTVYAAASPTSVAVGDTVAHFASAALPSTHDTISYLWTFGDGSTGSGASPTHSYSAPGLYTAIVTGTDANDQTDVAAVTIQVTGTEATGSPTARFTTSSVVGFVGQPLTFDASFSTDPGNDLTDYSWDFGDGSAPGSGQVISRTYAAPGSYVVSLTVTNENNLSDSTVRVIEVLDAAQAATFDASLALSAKWSIPSKTKDSLQLSGDLNIGDTFVGANTPVALTIAGTQYSATLNASLMASTPTGSWKFKSNLRGQAFGTVSFAISLKNVDLESGFTAAGIVPGTDPNAPVNADILVTLSIGGRSVSVTIPSTFKFSGGKSARGGGNL